MFRGNRTSKIKWLSYSNGLPLKYTRTNFLNDLSKIYNETKNTPQQNHIIQNIINNQIGIVPNWESNKITGYNGILTNKNLSLNNQYEKEIYKLINKFLYENEIKTNNKELNRYLNIIIKMFPEFINTIGKKQHTVHNYSIDTHSLLVMSEIVNNKDYLNKITSEERSMLKITAIMHDLMKKEKEVDKEHPFQSAIYTGSILKKLYDDSNKKDRIYNMIKNHNWLEYYSNSEDKEQKAKETAFIFRRVNDFEAAKIFTQADLKSISKEFYKND